MKTKSKKVKKLVRKAVAKFFEKNAEIFRGPMGYPGPPGVMGQKGDLGAPGKDGVCTCSGAASK